MLTIITRREDWPTDTIINVDYEFATNCSLKDEFATHFTLEKVERSRLLNGTTVIDRYGYKLFRRFLSTGTKALLLAVQSGKAVCFDECGDNVLGTAIMLSSKYDMCICYSHDLNHSQPFIDECVNISVNFNGNVITELDDIFLGGLIDVS